MGFAQLYYTSCEHGLSGYAGYQFNAATPGVDPRVLREVERFTVYEPPRRSSPAGVAGHPVNLCYAPDLGGVPVVSRVVSSGDDPSGRPGNYFAHSLVPAGGDGAGGVRDGDPLPAELWDAGFWAEAPVRGNGLPVLEVRRGPLDRRRTEAWARGLSPEAVVRLLVCADGAVDGARPLVLVADSSSVAHWVAALTHLMPPGRARMLSFATYGGDPDGTPVHVVGVPPGTDTSSWEDRFTVHAPEADPPGRLPEPDERSRAVADRLVRAGARGAVDLWRGAAPYASGRERRLADWRPVLAASAALAGGPSGPEDVRAVREWLPEAVEWLATGDTVSLATWVLDSGAGTLDDGALTGVQGVAHRVGADEVTERIERVLVRRSLDGIAGGGTAPRVAPMRSDAVRAAARERISALLAGAPSEEPPHGRAAWGGTEPDGAGPEAGAPESGAPGAEAAQASGGSTAARRGGAGDAAPGPGAPARRPPAGEGALGRRSGGAVSGGGGVAPDRAVELLRWARAGGLAPSAVSLERYGREVVAPLLADPCSGRPPASGGAGPAPPAGGRGGAWPDPAVAFLLSHHHEVRRGAAERLAALPPDRLADVAVGPVGALFAGDRDGASARLRELRRLGTDDRSDPVGLLAYVVSVRREGRASNAPGLAEHDLDDALLTEVWGPGHGPHSTLLALRAMRPGVLVSPGVGGWVAEAMVAAPAPDGERAWRDLVDEVSRHWLRDRLPVAGQRVVVEWSEVRPLLAGLHRAGEEQGPERLAAVYRALVEVHPAVDAVARRTVVRVLSGWRSPGTLAAALRGCPEDVFGAFCGEVAARLADDRPDTATAAVVYLVAGHEDLAGHERGRRLDSAVLSPAVAAWRRRHLAGVRRQLPREGAAAFDEWARLRRGDGERRRFGLGRRTGGRRS
ncbi:GTPase-associated protein 1-related protein [Nocardiopsis sp. NPDC101807]|uniref:GTPase-associated protein 1-related protein n=1 Tax=Nocardiopsis sp. NPDC101807 TaxID=3364339 RepID=UPI003827956C